MSLARVLRKAISRAMLVAALVGAVAFVGCTDDGGTDKPNNNTTTTPEEPEAKPEKPKVEPDEVTKWVDERLQGEYYWLDIYNENLDNFDYSLEYDKFLSTSLLSLTGNEMDGYTSNGKRYLYSYITRESTSRAADDRMENSFGISIAAQYYAGDNNTAILVIQHVYPGSPAAEAGIKRGDYVTAVDGTSIPSPTSNLQQFYSLRDKIEYGTGSITIEGETYDRKSGRDLYYKRTLTAASYDPNPVAYYSIIKLDEHIAEQLNLNGKKIGYLSYLGFESEYDDKLIEAMQYLAARGVTDLILDLRYNGGGSVNTSIMLASMLLSEEYIGKTYATLKRHPENTRYPKHQLNTECLIVKNGLGDFEDVDLPNLNLPSLWVIASDYTASASEMVIKGLEGLDVPVKLVGKTTNGKNCGMDVMQQVFGQYIYTYAPITFMNYNGKGDNDYADGITPGKAAIDNSTPGVNFDKYYDKTNPTKDILSYECYVFPLPRANWGELVFTEAEGGGYNFSGDFALYETILRICGRTMLVGGIKQSKTDILPAEMVTRAVANRTIGEAPPVPQGRAHGATLTEAEREAIEKVR